MCNSIDSNFAIGMFWRDLSFEIDSPLITNAVFSRLTREWTVRLFNFSFADWSQILNDIFISKKTLSNDGLFRFTILPAIVFWNNENNDIQN